MYVVYVNVCDHGRFSRSHSDRRVDLCDPFVYLVDDGAYGSLLLNLRYFPHFRFPELRDSVVPRDRKIKLLASDIAALIHQKDSP